MGGGIKYLVLRWLYCIPRFPMFYLFHYFVFTNTPASRHQTSSPRITLKILYTLRDTSTAESYASSGGLTGVVSTKVGVSAAEGCGLSDWSGWFAKGSGGAGTKGGGKRVQDGDMLKMLLEVYMEDGCVSSFMEEQTE